MIDTFVDETMYALPHVVAHSGKDVESDVLEAWRRYAHLYYATLATLELPSSDEIAEFEQVARRRLHQSVGLEDLHAAFRRGARILLEHALMRVDPVDAGMVASITMEFADQMTTAAERAYLEEQRSMSATESDYTVELLLQLFRGEVRLEDAKVPMAPVHGYDFARTYTVVSFAPSARATPMRHASGPELLPMLGTVLRSVLPFALQVQRDDDTLTVLVPGDAVSNLAKLLTRMLSGKFNGTLRAGISIPTAGLAGVLPSAEQATRARRVGEVLQPDVLVHVWDHVRALDIFRGANEVETYVEEQLGPLIQHDKRKGTQLVETLAAFLEANGNRKTAARNLTVHINTLDYRLRQIRSILGDEIFAERSFAAHLAVRLFPLYRAQNLPPERSLGPNPYPDRAGEVTTATNASAV
ncbi:PucR family transcriptional regulator [Nocardioides gansuensis]|nr:helix-turn-helix domain-containing protein [Nocardioides gansuensis]